MDTLISPQVFQVVGALIAGAALIQVLVMLVASYSRFTYASERRRLALEALRAEVAATSARSRAEQERTVLSWKGIRKFRIQRKVPEGGDICSFYLVPHDGKAVPTFLPGQYLTFQLKIPGQDKPVIRCY